MHPISHKLITWYKKHQRDLPWRLTNDPYKIWLSEIMLQQTQVAQGMSYYLKFVEQFPTVVDLANAPEDKVMRLWQGLGYYSRARNLHTAAKQIKKEYKGVFPNTYETIKELKGVGDYTAAAISSFAFNLPYAVVDGNVYRVLARLFDIHTAINTTPAKKEFQLLANELLNKNQPALHNNAIMEFGALCCKPQNPQCNSCPLHDHCMAFQNNSVSVLPVKNKTIKIKNRYFNYLILNYKNAVYITKRTEKDIWQNMYEFLLVETDNTINEEELLNHHDLKALQNNFVLLKKTVVKKHVLSHQHLYATFYELQLTKVFTNKAFIKINKEELNNYALPQLINRYLQEG